MAIRDYTKINRPQQAGTMIGVRLQPDALAQLDAWISAQQDAPTRPEAIRRLIEAGLRVEQGKAAS